MIRFARQCAAMGRRDLALQRSYGVSGAVGVVAGLLGLVAYHYIGRLVGDHAARLPGGSYFAFVWSGVMVQVLVAATMGGIGSALARDAAEGTLESELAAGASPLALVLGAALAPFALAGLQLALHALAGAVCFDLDLGAARPGPLLAALLLSVIACAPIGVTGAALWLVTRRAGLVTTAALFLFGVVGGVYFPLDLLPAPLAAAADWVPFTVGLAAVRGALLEGAGWTALAPDFARLVAISALGFPPAVGLLLASLRRAERRGTLALV